MLWFLYSFITRSDVILGLWKVILYNTTEMSHLKNINPVFKVQTAQMLNPLRWERNVAPKLWLPFNNVRAQRRMEEH